MSQFHTLTIADLQHETRDTVVVTFAVPPALKEDFQFTQGQHLTLRAAIDGEEVRRSYSICSAVQDDALRVAIKKVPGGVFSTWATSHLKSGMTLEVMPAMGHFNVPLSPAHRKHYLGFAAGSGITPLYSLIKTTLLAEPHSRFTLVYGNRASSTVIFREALSDLKDTFLDRLSLIYIMSREQQDADLFNGRIDAEKCKDLFRQWITLDDIDTAFICGPEQMMHAVSAALLEQGMAKEKIKVELFAASMPAHRHQLRAELTAGSQQCEVTVIVDGRHLSFSMEKDKESVLDAGLRQGIDLRYACKGGVCSTCRCKVLSGSVDMDVNYALEDYEIARGFVLSCQAFPSSESLVIDFDQDN
jgi:ring-1,2-phenylacetyl-CoA epoxidase subunit PaaE